MNWKDAAEWSDRYRSSDTSTDVLVKVMEEVGELAAAHYRYKEFSQGNDDSSPQYLMIEDAIGDISLTLMVYAHKVRIDYERAIEGAWEIVRNRT